ncbi:hypothetical protein B0H17DRAFT_1139805 [Mycena rosella]|uniref:Uncharacterized protein n=1 Tax=Mycena rosella TaxID=1033263 RepID=A0AAD7D3N4_MYCRO|nr:hypothetical protein B0H17DRAFT_1139805 [Mycena rosella]
MSSSGNTQFVEVGATASSPGGAFQFNPNTIVASNGTIVAFRFTAPGNHSVTRSSFEAPCTPLDPTPAGVDSGFVPPLADPTQVAQWSFTVENDQIRMVFVLNPSASQPFAAFQNAAETADAASPTSSAPGSQSSSGSTSSDSISNTAVTAFTSSDSVLSSPTHSSTDVPRPGATHVPVAAIAGTIVGALLLSLLCIAGFLVRRRRLSARNRGPRPFSTRPDSAFLELGPGDGVDTRVEPLILYEKKIKSPLDAAPPPLSNSTSALPTVSEAALMTMAEEMRLLRQVQRLELDR